MPVKDKLDYSDYQATPDDGKRYELIDGELYVTPSPSLAHQRTAFLLGSRLAEYFEGRGLGVVFPVPVDLILTERDVVQPDILVASRDQFSSRGIEGPPLLVVEILSPSTEARDRLVKAQRYARLGVPHYWLVDAVNRHVECMRIEGDRYVLVATAEGNATLIHPDWEGLVIELPSLWI